MNSTNIKPATFWSSALNQIHNPFEIWIFYFDNSTNLDFISQILLFIFLSIRSDKKNCVFLQKKSKSKNWGRPKILFFLLSIYSQTGILYGWLVGYLFPLNWTMSTGDDIVTELYAKINENNKKVDRTQSIRLFKIRQMIAQIIYWKNHIKFFSSLIFIAAINFSLFYFYYFGASWFFFLYLRKIQRVLTSFLEKKN